MANFKSSAILKVHTWSVISLLTSFISLMVVIPHLSANPELFGIYSICLSITLYLSYADLGFLSAGQKFAAEAYGRNDIGEEIAIAGFSIFVLIAMFIPFSIFSVYIANNPEILLNNLSVENRNIAKNLFLIIGLLLPIQIVLQRLVTFVLSIRVMNYIELRVNILVNIIKIASVFFFFTSEVYLLAEYFLFITLMSIIGSFLTLIIIKVMFNYNFIALIKKIKYQPEVYKKMGALAISSFCLSISFIVYYELDSILISKLIGIEEVAIFAIGLTLLKFVKTLTNLFYGPFLNRLNQFAGRGEDIQINAMIQKILNITLPGYLILVLVLVLSTKYLILFWVGSVYESSILITKLLFISLIFTVYNSPASYYYNVALKYKYIYAVSICAPIIFLASIFLLYPISGLIAFAWTKVIIGVFICVFSIITLKEIVSVGKDWVLRSGPLLAVLILIFWLYPIYLDSVFPVIEKNTTELLLLVMSIGATVLISYLFVILCNTGW
ncbi:hypothetical protein N9Q72_04520, partial [Gammaproteobacteria bacterium]|nr:hypothetical protein [Gammaproteobacteria bacterium]